MVGQRRWTVPSPPSIKLVSTRICEIVTEMWLVVSLRSYAVRYPPWVRQQCTVKSPLLLSTLVVISLYKEEKKLAGPLAKKELPAEGCSISNGKREEGSRKKKQMIDTIMTNWLWRCIKEGWEEGRMENAEFAVKDLPLCSTLWLIDIHLALLCLC